MKMVLWCNEKKGVVPAAFLGNPEWRARHIGDFEVEFAPRLGEDIQLRNDDEDDSCYEVTSVVHVLCDRELYVEIEWVPPEETT